MKMGGAESPGPEEVLEELDMVELVGAADDMATRGGVAQSERRCRSRGGRAGREILARGWRRRAADRVDRRRGVEGGRAGGNPYACERRGGG